MKQIKMLAIVMAIVWSGISSCSKDGSGTSTATTLNTTSNSPGGASFTGGSGGTGGSTQKGPIASILIDHDWLVNSYSGPAADFQGWNFNFAEMNYIAATYMKEAVYNGTWILDESAKTIYFDFGETISPLTVLEGTWVVTSADASVVTMVKRGSGATISLERTINTY